MKIVAIPFQDQRIAAGLAIEMSYWCRDLGLERGRDYDWYFLSQEKKIHFRFYGDRESYATMFALKWTGHEV